MDITFSEDSIELAVSSRNPAGRLTGSTTIERNGNYEFSATADLRGPTIADLTGERTQTSQSLTGFLGSGLIASK